MENSSDGSKRINFSDAIPKNYQFKVYTHEKKITIVRSFNAEDEACETAYKWIKHGFYEKIKNRNVYSDTVSLVEFKEVK